MNISLPRFKGFKKPTRILLRVDFNVPIAHGKVQDDFRIKKIIPVIRRYQNKDNKIILISHMENENNETLTLVPVAKYLNKNGLPVRFCQSITGEETKKEIERMQKGDILLLENLRKDPREKKNDTSFAKELAELADIFINDAFSASHRAHASIIGIPRFVKSFAGDLFYEEVTHLLRAFQPSHPFLLIVGGRKPIKVDLVYAFLRKADSIVVGGVIANTLLSAKGMEVGKSVIEPVKPHVLRTLIFSKKILLPKDVVVLRKHKKIIIQTERVEKEDVIYDVGPKTQNEIEKKVRSSSFIVWNGPLGYVEKGFSSGTRALLDSMRKKGTKKEIIIGGGDTIAFINKQRRVPHFTFVSLGGGAMLEFLAKGTLPGIEALIKSNKITK